MQQVKKCEEYPVKVLKSNPECTTFDALIVTEYTKNDITVFDLPPTSHSIVKEHNIYLQSNYLSYVRLDPCDYQRQSENDGLLPLRNLILIQEEFRRGGGSDDQSLLDHF